MTYNRSNPDDRTEANKARQVLGPEPTPIDERIDWTQFADPDDMLGARLQPLIAEPQARGLVGFTLRDYVRFRTTGATPEAARESAMAEQARRSEAHGPSVTTPLELPERTQEDDEWES